MITPELNLHLDFFVRLFLAAFFGYVIGLEREVLGRTAGSRTFSLVALGAALFAILSTEIMRVSGGSATDPSRISSMAVSGIGFIAGGIIIFRQGHLEGVTTAAGLWVVTAIGLCFGHGLYDLAIFTALLSLFILFIMHHVHVPQVNNVPTLTQKKKKPHRARKETL